MATHARQQYFADENSLKKDKREFSISDDVIQKIDSIEPGAQVNKIETVKVNGTALVPDANKAVNVEVPEVIDNLYTVDPDNALSAKQGKLLYDYIQNIASRGRFLSNWNSATGLPMTNPSENPYLYKSGDYFVVSNVAGSGGTNYRPDGSSYIIGQASTVTETEDVSVSDFYFYDGTNWLLLSNSGRQIAIDTSLSTTSTNPVENRVITNALNGKANDTDVVHIAGDEIITGGKTFQNVTKIQNGQGTGSMWIGGNVNANTVTNNNRHLARIVVPTFSDITKGTTLLGFDTSGDSDMSVANKTYDVVSFGGMKKITNATSPMAIGFTVTDTREATAAANKIYALEMDANEARFNVQPNYNGDNLVTSTQLATKQDKIIAGTNIQIAADGKTISATDTTYTAGTGINIDANNVISTTTTPGQTYTAGNGINIDSNNEISVDTTVVATQTDVNNKVNKGVNNVSNSSTTLFSIVDNTDNYSATFGSANIGIHSQNDLWWGTLNPGNVNVGGQSQGNTLYTVVGYDHIVINDTTNNIDTTYALDKINYHDGFEIISENYEFSGGGNNQIARLKDVKTYTAGTGVSINANNQISNTLPGPTIAATAPTGTEGALWYDTTNNVLMAHDGTSWKEAGTQMKVLSYGHSTWQDFINAYNENAIVYCRASSNSNPGSGVQGRMAFMAFVSLNSSTGVPQNVEFQYYRSRSDHNTQANQLDEVYVYKLESNGTWTVTQRNTGAKAVAGTGINLAFGGGNMTISADTTTLATKTDLNSKQDTLVSGTNIKTVNNESLLGSGNITISAPTYTAGENITIDQNNKISAVDTTYTAGTGIEIKNGNDYSAMQGPAQTGFHIPSPSEWEAVKTAWTSLGGGSSDGTNFGIALKLPFAGRRFYHDSSKDDEDVTGFYWTSTAYDTDKGRYLEIDSSTINCQMVNIQSFGHSLRAFKDEPVTPTTSWTKLYGTSIAAGGIFWNSTDGLISISGNGQTWITIQDKNLGATTVRNDGDYLSRSNCGYIYQWGNNYGFLWQGNIITDNVKVDTTGYGPGNYYSGSAFITVSAGSWSSVRNDDLWGGSTGIVTLHNAITNIGVLSGDNGVIYTIKVSNSDPASGTPNTTITLVP